MRWVDDIVVWVITWMVRSINASLLRNYMDCYPSRENLNSILNIYNWCLENYEKYKKRNPFIGKVDIFKTQNNLNPKSKITDDSLTNKFNNVGYPKGYEHPPEHILKHFGTEK